MSNIKTRYFLVINNSQKYYSTKKKYLFLNYPIIEKLRNNKFNKYYSNKRWENNLILNKDYKYLNSLYENYLEVLSNYLNKKNKKNFSIKYWRIVLGPWLFTFICVIFERWNSLNNILIKYKNLETVIPKYKINDVIPYGIEDFNYFINTDFWNYYIYSEIIKFLKTKKIYLVKSQRLAVKDREIIYARLTKIWFFERIYFLILILLKCLFRTNNNIFLIFNSYFRFASETLISFLFSKEFQLNKSLKFNYLYNHIDNFHKLITRKKNILLKKNILIKENIKFEKFLDKQIILNLPKSSLEYYNQMENIIDNSFLPKNPKFILTTFGINRSLLMDRYIARCIENGSKLIITQHGGCYGQYMFHWCEENEKKIADLFLNYGWKSDKKNLSFGIIKNIKNNNSFFKKKLVILELRIRDIYSGRLDVTSGFSKIASYYELINKFISLIQDEDLLKIFQVKLHARTTKWDEKKYILNSNKNINFSNPYKNTLDLSSRLIIYTGLSTGHLESLSINKPLLILVNIKNEPFKKKYHKYILQMKKIGILYDDPYELYKKIIQIYQNVDEWWNSKEIQIFRESYVKEFSKMNYNKINNTVGLLNKLRSRIK
jgi:putative transferase (TIGR04331 family)